MASCSHTIIKKSILLQNPCTWPTRVHGGPNHTLAKEHTARGSSRLVTAQVPGGPLSSPTLELHSQSSPTEVHCRAAATSPHWSGPSFGEKKQEGTGSKPALGSMIVTCTVPLSMLLCFSTELLRAYWPSIAFCWLFSAMKALCGSRMPSATAWAAGAGHV